MSVLVFGSRSQLSQCSQNSVTFSSKFKICYFQSKDIIVIKFCKGNFFYFLFITSVSHLKEIWGHRVKLGVFGGAVSPARRVEDRVLVASPP